MATMLKYIKFLNRYGPLNVSYTREFNSDGVLIICEKDQK